MHYCPHRHLVLSGCQYLRQKALEEWRSTFDGGSDIQTPPQLDFVQQPPRICLLPPDLSGWLRNQKCSHNHMVPNHICSHKLLIKLEIHCVLRKYCSTWLAVVTTCIDRNMKSWWWHGSSRLTRKLFDRATCPVGKISGALRKNI